MTWDELKEKIDTLFIERGMSGKEKIYEIEILFPKQDDVFQLFIMPDDAGINIYNE